MLQNIFQCGLEPIYRVTSDMSELKTNLQNFAQAPITTYANECAVAVTHKSYG